MGEVARLDFDLDDDLREDFFFRLGEFDEWRFDLRLYLREEDSLCFDLLVWWRLLEELLSDSFSV